MQQEPRNVTSANEGVEQSMEVVPSGHHEITPPAAPAGAERFALPSVQEIALQRLTAGSSIVDAARAARVDRRTIQRWIRSDPHFGAAYNAWQHEMLASGRARLLAMADMALDTVQSALLQGNARVAVQVAKATGVMDAPKPGTTDPGLFHRRKRLRDAKWQKELASAESSEAHSRRGEDYRHPVHCEYMIDSYIKCRREALRAESPENRARRLEQQPKYRRNYDPITLRLIATMDAEDAAAPPAAPAPDEAPTVDPSPNPPPP
jgi:hypothetical protein